MQIGQEYANNDATQNSYNIIGLHQRPAPLPHSLIQLVVDKHTKTKQNT